MRSYHVGTFRQGMQRAAAAFVFVSRPLRSSKDHDRCHPCRPPPSLACQLSGAWTPSLES